MKRSNRGKKLQTAKVSNLKSNRKSIKSQKKISDNMKNLKISKVKNQLLSR